MRDYCGFLVVRKPEHAFGPDDYHPEYPPINGVYYSGVDRMEWYDIDTAIMDVVDAADISEIPQTVINGRKALKKFVPPQICSDFALAKELLDFSNAKSSQNELCALRCIRGSFVSMNGAAKGDQSIQWLGYDIIGWVGSAIKEGIFSHPSVFQDYNHRINEYGLFDVDDLEVGENYLQDYFSRENGGDTLEPMSDSYDKLDWFEIGRIAT